MAFSFSRLARRAARLRDQVLSRTPGRDKPWESKHLGAPRAIYATRGMLGPEERRALYWIGRDFCTGHGAVVDAGAYIGSSALCLAAGLAENERAGATRPIVYSYDFFQANDPYVAEHISQEVRPLKVGDDYLDIYRDQTRAFASYVEPIQGDFLESRWSSGPIEVLFVDVAKTQCLNAHVIREFFPHLIPGRSLVVHQDFYHGWHPYIHVTMQALKDYFELVDGHIRNQSRLYRLKAPIPAEVLTRVADYAFSPQERLALLDDFATSETGDMRAMADVVKICQLRMDGDYAGADAVYARFVKTYEHAMPKDLWWEQAKVLSAETW